jgi:hypothetical protein
MYHLVVLTYAVSMGSGVAAFALFSFLFSRTRDSVIRTYIPYLTTYTLLIATVSVMTYVTANGLVGLNDFESLVRFLRIYLASFVPFIGGFIFTVPRFYAAFLGVSLSRRTRTATIILSLAAAPLLAALLSGVGFLTVLILFITYAAVSIAVSTWVAFVVVRRRPFVRDPLVRASISVISILFGSSMAGAFGESFLMARLYSNSRGTTVYFSL